MIDFTLGGLWRSLVDMGWIIIPQILILDSKPCILEIFSTFYHEVLKITIIKRLAYADHWAKCLTSTDSFNCHHNNCMR